jgi:hypothetical protein
LADGVTIASARAEMETIGRRLASSYPSTNQGFRPVVMTFHEFFLGPNAATLYGSMWVAVAFVLLIACANLANLLLARATGRSREIGDTVANLRTCPRRRDEHEVEIGIGRRQFPPRE